MSDQFDSMSNEELRQYARENFSTIARGSMRNRQKLIDVMRYQIARTEALQAAAKAIASWDTRNMVDRYTGNRREGS